MARDSVLRFLFIGGLVILLFTFGSQLFGGSSTAPQPLRPETIAISSGAEREQLCHLRNPAFHATISSRGASVKRFELTTPKYVKFGKTQDLSTTPDQPFRQQLAFMWRNEAAKRKDIPWQLDFDLVRYDLVQSSAQECVFRYRDANVELTRVVASTANPYELLATATIKNLAPQKRVHALTVHTVAWRTQQEVAGHMFSVSPFVTHVECIDKGGHATRLREPDFEAGNFTGEGFQPTALNLGDWHKIPGEPDIAAVSNAYFSHALIPKSAPAAPECQLQIEQRWDASRHPKASDDINAGAMYRARLAYPAQVLDPGKEQTYSLLSYAGPKERDALSRAGGGQHHVEELIDLGLFTVIAKVLVAFLLKVYSIVPNWGIAIIVLTITARTLLFPLTLPSIKSMMKMRELKPELDELNIKYKDDAQAKGLAQMELWRKHKVNPLKGCLPQLASMPVWFALYTTLQTAVELYNIPFLWFPDLSLPDPYFILPFIIGSTSYVQQKMMPAQGDPAQQKMMLYFMPAMFTVFMLFLPAGLGVYMFTNSLLGILQQQGVEAHVRRTQRIAASRAIEVKVKG